MNKIIKLLIITFSSLSLVNACELFKSEVVIPNTNATVKPTNKPESTPTANNNLPIPPKEEPINTATPRPSENKPSTVPNILPTSSPSTNNTSTSSSSGGSSSSGSSSGGSLNSNSNANLPPLKANEAYGNITFNLEKPTQEPSPSPSI